MQKSCKTCIIIRTTLACALLGSLAGWIAQAAGLSSQLSMTATFFGAFLPLVWFIRHNNSSQD